MEKQQQAQTFLEAHGNKLGVALAVLIGVGTGVAIYLSKDSSPKIAQSTPIQAPATLTQRSAPIVPSYTPSGKLDASFTPKIRAIMAMAQNDLKQGSSLSIRTVMTLITLTADHVKPQFVANLISSRTARRAIDNQSPQYGLIVAQAMAQVEQLMDSAAMLIIAECGIDQQIYSASCEHLAQTNQQFAMMAMSQMEMLKSEVPSAFTPSREAVIEFLKFSMEQWDNVTAGDAPVGIPKGLLKKSILDDLCAESLGIEEENLLMFVKGLGPQLMQDQELMMLLQGLQMKIQQEMMAGGM